MRNRSILLISLMFFAGVVSAEIKIGYVDFARIMEVLKSSPQVDKEKKKMEKEIASTTKLLQGMEKEIKKMQTKLERDASVMNESERRKIEKRIIKKVREAKRAQVDLREDMTTRQNELAGSLQLQVIEVSKEIAEKENFDLLLHSGALYASEKINITDKVLKKLGGLK